MNKTSIIIPTFNGLAVLEQCISSIRAYTELPYEIIVVDNGSKDGTAAYCVRERLTLVALPDNRGFAKACNLGMKIANGERLLLLNNDTVVSERWLDNLSACLDSQPAIGIVGPHANLASGKQQLDLGYQTIAEFQQKAKEFNQPNSDKWLPMERIVGLCMLFKRELADKIGLLDEQFAVGTYEDDDYCYRARKAGYELRLAGDVMIHHHGSSSFQKLNPVRVQQVIQENKERFIRKWNFDPNGLI